MNAAGQPSDSLPYRTVTEVPVSGPVPFVSHPEWSDRFPGLCQGSTVRGPNGGFDMGLFGPGPSGDVQDRWDQLARATGFARVVHGRQVHGSRVATHVAGPESRLVVAGCDGHVTIAHGTLLTVAGADCVPVFLVTSEGSAVALLHAGWRGVVAGILEEGIAAVLASVKERASSLVMHLGPAICGQCYEVGPEVHRALGQRDPGRPLPIDLRRVLADRAVAAGIDANRITVSSLCTHCSDGLLFSHRRGDSGRQVAVLGIERNA